MTCSVLYSLTVTCSCILEQSKLCTEDLEVASQCDIYAGPGKVTTQSIYNASVLLCDDSSGSLQVEDASVYSVQLH